MTLPTFNTILYIWIALAVILFPIQFWWVTAPYGRHTNKKWGWLMDNRWGWFLMEIISPLCFSFFFLNGPNEKSWPMWVFFSLWLLHYINRSIIYPFRTKTTGKKIPVLIVLFAIIFNSMNGWSNGYYLGTVGPVYSFDWFFSLPFIFGFSLFIVGAFININSDNYLLQLRKPGSQKYVIPQGGLFKYISCPNHFGEILEWVGFAILSWNIAAVGFAVWTAANLIPRAMSHHKWYLQYFEDYPKNRKAVIPFLI